MRTLSWKRLAVAGLVAAITPAVVLWITAHACGPDFEPEVFVPANGPEQPALFADGQLGILQPGYYHANLVVAYRLLSGGTLGDAEKKSYIGGPQATGPDRDMWSGPAVDWLRERQTVGDVPIDRTQPQSLSFEQERTFKTARDGAQELDFGLNCPDAAFRTAIDTLHQRTARWGAHSTELVEWLRGQDAVFSNCSKAGSMPDLAKPEWPLLLRQDRAYQIAAAKFYSADYDGAIADFVAIGKDKSSPWSNWGEYLAARAEVRKAAMTGPAVPRYSTQILGTYDPQELKAAESRLLNIQKETQDTGIRNAAATELGYVEVRLNPGKRLDQVADALAGPKPDPQFDQDFADLDYLLDRGVTGSSDLARWIKEVQFSSPNPPAPGTVPALQALSLWRTQHSTPWLVAAMSQVKSKDAPADLLAAAATIKRGSPAFATVNYYRISLLSSTGKAAEARALADTVIAGMGPETMASTRNEFLAVRMTTARNLAEFLADAPRTIIGSSSENADLARCDTQPADATQQPGTWLPCAPLQFDADAAGYLNTQMPLALLEQAAESSALPAHLRQAVAEMAWVRALALDDTAALARMAKLLPGRMRQTAGVGDGFPATLALLKAPGVRPYLDAGVQRSESFAELDHFRDNWWCGRWTDGIVQLGPNSYSGQAPTVLPPLAFLTPQQSQQAAAEATRMNALPQGLVWVGQRAIAYVKAHPEDKTDPETLALIVAATRWGCAEYNSPDAQKAVSKEAFEMLHSRYPKSEWALKTKYYY